MLCLGVARGLVLCDKVYPAPNTSAFKLRTSLSLSTSTVNTLLSSQHVKDVILLLHICFTVYSGTTGTPYETVKGRNH